MSSNLSPSHHDLQALNRVSDLTPPMRPVVRPHAFGTFETLSRVIVLLMGSAVLLSSLLLLPADWDFMDEELMSWCAGLFFALLTLTVALGGMSLGRR
jgi:hypothetical protein